MAEPLAIGRLAILGAAGDLTRRYLLPALAQLEHGGLLPETFRVVAVAKEAGDSDGYRRAALQALARHAQNVPQPARERLAARIAYLQADVTDPVQLAPVHAAAGAGPLAAYLALPPAVFEPTIRALSQLGLDEGSRIVIEKPFGDSLAAARGLNRLLHEHFDEDAIFRVDHFLAFQTVQNLLGLRFANRAFEYLWNREQVERVEIVWDETLALEGRASYYDRAGALKDMLQNHLLQLLCLVAMEPPLTLHERDLRDAKSQVLRAVRRSTPQQVQHDAVRARYAAGRIGDRAVPAYVDERGVDPQRGTETFAQLTLWIDNWRWAGVPFVLRSGKALRRDRHEIVLAFRGVPHLAFEANAPAPNVLRLQLEPDRICFGMNVTGAGDPIPLRQVSLVAELAPLELPAYSRVLLDILQARSTMSIRADEAELSWEIVEPVLAAWSKRQVPLLEYPAGTDGPAPPAN